MAAKKTTKPAPTGAAQRRGTTAAKPSAKPLPPMVSIVGQKKAALAKRVAATGNAGGRQIKRK